MYNSVNIVYGIVMLIGRRAIGEAASRRQTEKAATLCGRLLRSTTAGTFAYGAPSGMMITASSAACTSLLGAEGRALESFMRATPRSAGRQVKRRNGLQGN